MSIGSASDQRRVLIVRGDLNSYSGYSHATRLYLEWLEHDFDIILGVDLHGHPSRHVGVWPYPLIDDDYVDSAARTQGTDVVVLTISTPDNFRPFDSARSIGLFFWETNRLGNQAWVAAMNEIDEVWVPAKFMQPMLESEGVEVPVTYMPCPMPEVSDIPRTPFFPDLILSEIPLHPGASPRPIPLSELRASSDLLLLSTNTLIPRKGFPVLADEWLGVVLSHPRAALVLKVSTIDVTETSDQLFERVATLFAQVARRHHVETSRVYLCTGSLTHDTMRALGQVCDAFLTLSFGEGLGLGLFENLLAGKPAVCPRHTSFAEFLPSDYPYFLETEVANFGLADPVGVNPISAYWGVPLEGSLVATIDTLITDLREHRTQPTVTAAVDHFRKICRARAWERRI
jgi:glycosyltransferase involved in cell wall biosynthesis